MNRYTMGLALAGTVAWTLASCGGAKTGTSGEPSGSSSGVSDGGPANGSGGDGTASGGGAGAGAGGTDGTGAAGAAGGTGGTGGADGGDGSQGGAHYLVHVKCSPKNTFGYVGGARGDLAIGPRDSGGALTVSGALQLEYKFIDDPSFTTKQAQVKGTIDDGGQSLAAQIVSGADDLDSVLFVLADSPYSAINSKSGTSYQTDCSASTADKPKGSDLKPEGAMRFYDRGDGTVGVQINVFNIGNLPATGASGRVSIAGDIVHAALYQYFGGTATAPNTVNPHERGYLLVYLPQGQLTRCMQPQVNIDVDHTFQTGAPDPFANDTASVSTQCMTWSRPISMDSLGFATPDPVLEGKTLGGIVSSTQIGRTDNHLCSDCHYSGQTAYPQMTYLPPVTQGGSAPIAPNDSIGGTTWASPAPDGWGSQFLTTTRITKPKYLKDVFQQWIADGARP